MKRSAIKDKNPTNVFLYPLLALIISASCSKTSPLATTNASTSGLTNTISSVGPAGSNNNLIYYASADPDASIGCLGDYYLDISKGLLYGPKTPYGWGAALAMEGATAAQNQVYSGTEVPAPTFGRTGDFYLDTPAFMFFGPKSSTGWGTPMNLQHPGK